MFVPIWLLFLCILLIPGVFDFLFGLFLLFLILLFGAGAVSLLVGGCWLLLTGGH